MPGNIDPIFAKQQNASNVGIWTSSLTANVKSDGTSTGIATDMVKIFTAGANGAFVQKVRFTPSASTAGTATTASVHRLYLSTIASGATTRTDTFQIAEMAAPAQTADQTTTATVPLEIPLGFAMPASTTLLWSMHHAAAANTSWQAIVFGGDY